MTKEMQGLQGIWSDGEGKTSERGNKEQPVT